MVINVPEWAVNALTIAGYVGAGIVLLIVLALAYIGFMFCLAFSDFRLK